jgi:predicted metal-dependent phosphoesterase TrpH
MTWSILGGDMSNHHLDRRALLLAGAGLATSATLFTFEPAVAGTRRKKVFKGSFDVFTEGDWHYLPFEVPKGVRKIEVSYSYPPPDPSPTVSTNVIDIGIFDPDGFRGWSGGARDSFQLSKTSATPGYLPGRITPGRWRIALGPYQITEKVPYEVTVTLHFGKAGKRFVPAPAPTAVAERGQGWYRGDLHVHTVHSDGSQTQVDVVGYAKAAGLDFIGSAEHNTSSATQTWGRYVPDDLLVIPGEEITTRHGHWLASGVPAGTWIDWRYAPRDKRLGKLTRRVRKLGGLSIAAHPFIPVDSIRWDFGFDEMDAIEVWNGPWSGINAPANNATVQAWHDLLTAGTFKPAVGNSDTHKQSQTIGLAQTVVRAEALSTDAIIAGYRGGHSWIAESSAVGLHFTATLDDVSGECGDHVPSDPGQEVAVHLDVTGVPDCTAKLLGPGSRSFGTATAVDGTITLDAAVPGGTAFVRAEVRRGTSSFSPMVALTNPIFLTAAG